MNVRVVAVDGRRGADVFAIAARNARRGDPFFTPPFSLEAQAVFRSDGNPFNRRNPHAFLVAMRGETPVGRIMVVEDRDHLARHADDACHFGYFEAENDPAIAPVLFDAAQDWARRRGHARLEGPYSASINHEIGLLVWSDGTSATYRTNDAPARYATALEAAGFRRVRDILAYEGAVADSDLPERAAALAARWRDHARFALASFDPVRFTRSVALTNAVYADAWSQNWNAVAPHEDEARFIARLTLPFIRRDWMRIAHLDGRPAGIATMIPDLNEAARGLDGRLFPTGGLRFITRLKTGRVKRARIALIGVASHLRSTRAGAMVATLLLADAVKNARRAGIERIEISWMLDDNHAVLHLASALPARHSKTWRIFSREA